VRSPHTPTLVAKNKQRLLSEWPSYCEVHYKKKQSDISEKCKTHNPTKRVQSDNKPVTFHSVRTENMTFVTSTKPSIAVAIK
jgi:hypothetical protein